jgi:hypothetical protein
MCWLTYYNDVANFIALTCVMKKLGNFDCVIFSLDK